jgi:hypothetical protein
MNTAIFEKYAAARVKYPEDIERIEQEEARVKELLTLQGLSQHEGMLALVAACRSAIIAARKRLATDRDLINDPDTQRDLWTIIEARLWVLQMLARDFQGELMMIETGLDAELEHA